MSISQHVAAGIQISGPQATMITSTDLTDGGQGSYITVVTGIVMITLFDLAAAVTYRNAFAHPVDIVRLLPASSPTFPDIRHRTRPVVSSSPGPSVLIQAHGQDSTNFGYDQRENSLLVRIGSVTWTIRDLQAYTCMNSAFTKAHTLAQVIMPPTTPRR